MMHYLATALNIPAFNKTTKTLFTLCLITLFISACGGPQRILTEQPINHVDFTDGLDASQLLAMAQTSPSPTAEIYQLKAAQILYHEASIDDSSTKMALQLLSNIDHYLLPLEHKADYVFLSANIALDNNDGINAVMWLSDPTPGLYEQLSIEQQTQLSELRAQAFALNGQFLASARERIFFAPLLAAEQQQANQDLIWQALMKIPRDELLRFSHASPTEDFRGWLELAIISTTQQNDLDEQLAQLQDWQQRWPTHPASLSMPGGLSILEELAAERPKHVALLLPLNGKLSGPGKAVRDGFFAAYYDSMQRGNEVPKVTVVDTSTSNDFGNHYQQAVSQGATLVVGPLDKDGVKFLQQQGSVSVPTLSLNYADPFTESPQRLYQFGLAVEDEARQVAEKAWRDGHRNATVLVPDNAWGQRAHQAFFEQWSFFGGHIVGYETFTGQNDYSQAVSRLTNVDNSERRAKTLKRLIYQPVEFTGRRRQDMDFVFIAAHPSQARQIKPTLAFYYAGNIPVYATSHIYSGSASPSKDRDLNGIKFCDIPWLVNNDHRLKQPIQSNWSQGIKSYNRLYALGIDAYYLYPRLKQLELIEGSQIFGATGALTLNDQRKIERQLLWSHMKGGQALPMPSLAVDESTPTGVNY